MNRNFTEYQIRSTLKALIESVKWLDLAAKRQGSPDGLQDLIDKEAPSIEGETVHQIVGACCEKA